MDFLFGENMMRRLWLIVLGSIKRRYVGVDTKKASAIVDCCTFLEEEL
jgi:hypothetical protein